MNKHLKNTSDSINEELPITMAREKLYENDIFFMKG